MGPKTARLLATSLVWLCTAVAAPAQELLWTTLIESGDKATKSGSYKEAEKQFGAALNDAERFGDKDARLRVTLRKLAAVLDLSGKYDRAEPLLTRVVSLDERQGGAAGPELASDLSSLASVYRHQNKASDAESTYKKALAILEKNPGAAPLDLSAATTNLAALYRDMGRYAEAESLLKRSLSVVEKAGVQAGDVASATTLEQLAQLYSVQGRYSEAEPLMKKALALKEKALGLGNVALASELTDLGNLYNDQGNFTESEKYLKRALSLRQRELGGTHPDVAASLIDLADFYTGQSKYADATPLYERAIAIRQAALGKENHLVAEAMTRLAHVYLETDDYARAELLFKSALAIDESVFGKESRQVASDLSNLALLFLNQGKYHDAGPLYKGALYIVEQKAGADHPDTAACLNNLAWFYRTLGQWAEAEALLRRAIDIETSTLAPDHPDIAANTRELAWVLQNQKKWSDVEGAFRKLLEVDARTHAEDDAIIASDLDGLVRALRSQGKDQDAEPLAKRAMYIKEKLPGALVAAGTRGISPALSGTYPAAGRPIKDKWALVVGISSFKDPSINLKYAAKDATDFRNYLINEAQFKPDHVKLITDKDATRENIVANLGDRWLKRLANSDDLVVIYISSHGSSSKQEAGNANFIVPYDCNFSNLVFHGIPMQWLTAGVKDLIHSDRIVLVLDVCHGGAVAQGSKGIARDFALDPAKLHAGQGQVVVASSQADQISWESKKYPNGVFTRRLLEGLRKSGPRTKLNEAFEYMKEKVEEEVLRDRAQLQTPVLVTQWWRGEDVSLATTPVRPRPGLSASDGPPVGNKTAAVKPARKP